MCTEVSRFSKSTGFLLCFCNSETLIVNSFLSSSFTPICMSVSFVTICEGNTDTLTVTTVHVIGYDSNMHSLKMRTFDKLVPFDESGAKLA